jgi:excisionase family DNA binding protein
METTAETRRLLTPSEAARELRLSRQTVYRRIASGELEARRVGVSGPLRVPEEAVERLLRPARETGEQS